MRGDAFDQHGEYFARIALPVAAMQENQAGCRLVVGRIEIDLRPFAVAIGNIEKGLAAGAQRFGQPGFVSAISAALFFTAALLS